MQDRGIAYIVIDYENVCGRLLRLRNCHGCTFTLGAFGIVFLIFTRSRTGLRCSSSSTTYPPVVPSENVTTIPSLPSNSTASIWISPFIRRLLHWEGMADCSELLITFSASVVWLPGYNSPRD